MIKNLSPSRASQFKTCPKQFKYANVDKILEPTNEVQAKGTTVHQALEDLFDLPRDERTVENLHNLFRAAWTKVRKSDEYNNLFSTIEEERKWGVESLELLTDYFKIENPTEFDPIERERWVKGEIDDLNLRGILDRMDRNENGELVIVDYKSGSAPKIKYKEPRFFALKLYALLIKNEIGELPAELKLIYLKNKTVHTLPVTEKMIENAKKEILEIWDEIKKAYLENKFPPKKNILCDYCHYKNICPVFNKNAPDTDYLGEINIEIEKINEDIQNYDFDLINNQIIELENEIGILNMFKEDDRENLIGIKNLNIINLETQINELKIEKSNYLVLKEKLDDLNSKKEQFLNDINKLLQK